MIIFYLICFTGFVTGVIMAEKYDTKTELRELWLRLGLWLSGTSASCMIIFTVLFFYFKSKGAI